MVTLESIHQAARELRHGNGQTVPNIRLALWASILSSRNDIENNGIQTDNLRPFAHGGLPHDVSEVRHIIWQNGARPTTRKQAEAIIRVDVLAEQGKLAPLATLPQTDQEWASWRGTVATFYCMSWKTASFAALLLWPFHCPFVPVDSHVCARLNRMSLYRKISAHNRASFARYTSLENEVRAEWIASGADCSLAEWHWYKWEQHRQGETQATLWNDLPSADVGSHLLLSPYLYYPVTTSESV